MAGRRWSRKELLAVLYIEIRYWDEMASPQNHAAAQALAQAMDRTTASIAMRIANYRSLDPAYPGRGLEGGGGEAPFQRLWREYEHDPERVMAEARTAYREFVSGEGRTMGTKTEGRYKVIEASNPASLESCLNQEEGWMLHSFSACPNLAPPGTTSQQVIIIAVLEREQTAGRT